MRLKELMIESLTELLEDSETLMHPIYGLMNQGNNQYYGYFGFTDEYLLIALLSGKNITYTTRVPLDIKSIKIKQGAIFRQYTIDISFNNGGPCQIIASPKVLTIDTQKENFPLFLNYLKSRAPEQKNVNLKDIPGKKIRWQYFSIFIYSMLSFLPMVLIVMSILDIKAGKFIWTSVFETISIWLAILSPFIALAIFNTFLFGTTICVLNEKGVFLENDFIPWNKIKKIEYHPETPRRYSARFTYATFTISDQKVNEYQFDIVHFPIYGLKNIKKYAPDIKIETPKNKKISIIFMIILPSLIGLIMVLF